MKGRVSQHIATLQQQHTSWSPCHLASQSSAGWNNLSTNSSTLHIPNGCFVLFCNFMLHNKAIGYLSLYERTNAAIQIDLLMQVQPSSLPAYSRFLLKFDTDKLINSDLDAQQYWISAMEAAIVVASKTRATNTNHHETRRAWQSQWNTSNAIIAQIRCDVHKQVVLNTWVWSPTAMSGPRQPSPGAMAASRPRNRFTLFW